MRSDQFILALQEAGWKDTCDAQHREVRKLHAKLFPAQAELEAELEAAQHQIAQLQAELTDFNRQITDIELERDAARRAAASAEARIAYFMEGAAHIGATPEWDRCNTTSAAWELMARERLCGVPPQGHAVPVPQARQTVADTPAAESVVTPEAVCSVLTGLVSALHQEIAQMPQADLEKHWHFRWEPTASLAWNLYKFHKMLDLYGSFCRQWEERHNGSCCVVERVRDTYLMPKIRAFVAQVSGATAPAPVVATDEGGDRG